MGAQEHASRSGAEGKSIFRDLLESAPDGLVIVNSEGMIVMVNVMAERLFGYDRSQLLGQSVEILLPERLAGMHSAFRSGFMANPESRSIGQRSPLWARRRDGAEFPVEIALSPLKKKDDQVRLHAWLSAA